MLRGFAALHCYCVYKAEAYPVLQMTSEYALCSSTVAEVFSVAIEVSYSHDKPNLETSPKITKHPYLSIVAHPDPLGGLAPKLEPNTRDPNISRQQAEGLKHLPVECRALSRTRPEGTALSSAQQNQAMVVRRQIFVDDN